MDRSAATPPTQGIPLVRASGLRQIASTLTAVGEPVDRVLDRAGVSHAWLYAPPDTLMPALQTYRVYGEAARAVGTAAFGAMIGARPPTDIGTYGKLVCRSLTLLEGLRQAVALSPAHGGTTWMWLQDDPLHDALWLCRDGILPVAGDLAQVELWSLRSTVGAVRLAAGPAWKPDAVRFRAGKEIGDVLDSIEAFQGVPAAIGQRWGGIRIPRALLGLELPRRAVSTDLIALDEWAESAPSATFVDSLRQLVESLLDVAGEPSIEFAADAAGVHPRRLQRRLAAEGLTFRQVIDEMRYRRARALIDDGDRSLTEIAQELGYSDSAHFARAFRRWAGIAPATYRRAHSVIAG